MRVLITGAAGFIGGNVMHSLAAKGVEVAGIDNFSVYYHPEMKHTHIRDTPIAQKIQNIDICDDHAMNALFKKFAPTHVVHLAAQGGVRASKVDPIPYLTANQTGFMNVLSLSEKFGAEKFLYASSSSVYGERLTAPFKESDELFAPKSLYALSKLSNELIAKYLPQKETQRIGFRFFTVYGPWGRPDMAIFRLLASSRLKRSFKLTASTAVKRDFTFVDDVSEVVNSALLENFSITHSEIFNIARSSPYSLVQLFEVLQELQIPTRIEGGIVDPLDVGLTHGSVEKLNAYMLPVPKTSLLEGVSRTWDWMNRVNEDDLKAWFEYSGD